MLARRELPAQYAQWNRVWGAPYGRRWPNAVRNRVRGSSGSPAGDRLLGFSKKLTISRS